MGSPSPAGAATQALEAGSDYLSRAAYSRYEGSRCQASCRQRPTVVAQLGDEPPHGAAEQTLRRTGGAPDRRVTSTRRTARCGPACRVVWQGTWRQLHAPMPIQEAVGTSGADGLAMGLWRDGLALQLL